MTERADQPLFTLIGDRRGRRDRRRLLSSLVRRAQVREHGESVGVRAQA